MKLTNKKRSNVVKCEVWFASDGFKGEVLKGICWKKIQIHNLSSFLKLAILVLHLRVCNEDT